MRYRTARKLPDDEFRRLTGVKRPTFELMLTPGQAHDLTCAEQLIDSADPDALLADKAYDADLLIDTLTQRGITPVIPPKANRKAPRACDFALYCERNLIERFFNKLTHFRAIATRCDKLAKNFPRRRSTGVRYHPAQLKTGPKATPRNKGLSMNYRFELGVAV